MRKKLVGGDFLGYYSIEMYMITWRTFRPRDNIHMESKWTNVVIEINLFNVVNVLASMCRGGKWKCRNVKVV